MISCPYTPEAAELLQKGQIALARATVNGIPIDVPYCRSEQKILHDQMAELEDSAWKLDCGGSDWQKRYGSAASLGNDNQVRDILFTYLKLEPEGTDEDELEDGDGSDAVDKDVLGHIDHPLARVVLQYRKARKTADTFLQGLIAEQVDGVVHPWFHLHRVISYRSSSSAPDFQNFPIRDPVQGGIVRRAFVSGDGWCFIEIDYKGIEVAISTCYHKDPTMVQYQVDDYDFHSDSARDVYVLTKEQLATARPRKKDVRHAGKNGFTFPEFYGSYWSQIGPALWRMAIDGKFALADGTSFQDHLASKGIRELGRVLRDPVTNRTIAPTQGTFLHHVQKVEQRFWNERFPVYNQWKKDWYALYQKRGWFKSKTGFHHEGVYRRNDVTNHPIQGDAFHCNLRSFYRLDEELVRRRMESYLCGQIHDSIVARVRMSERDEFLLMVRDISQRELVDVWKWIIVPIRVDAEGTAEGGSWYDKREIELNGP